MSEQTQQVKMTAEDMALFAKMKEAQAKKEAEAKKKEDRDAYSKLVDESIKASMPMLLEASTVLTNIKNKVIKNFQEALELKKSITGVSLDTQQSYTFTTSDGKSRVIIGYNTITNYKDTVYDGIKMVKDYVESLAKDDDSKMLVKGILALLAKDKSGNIQPARLLQLWNMAEESGSEQFMEGVKMIREAYNPIMSRQFVRVMTRDEKKDQWNHLPLGMTEA